MKGRHHRKHIKKLSKSRHFKRQNRIKISDKEFPVGLLPEDMVE